MADVQQVYDVIVIGGGPIGQASAYHLAKQQAKTLVLEQYTFKNQLGSSAGVSRQFRIPYPDQYMVQMALDSQPYWDELQALSSVPLRDTVGTLWFGDPEVQSTEGNIKEAMDSMDALGVPYTALTCEQIEADYRFSNLPEHYTGLFQADGASINLPATIQTLLDYNQASEWVSLLEESPVTDIQRIDGVFTVSTPSASFQARKLIIVPGPYVNNVTRLLHFQVDATYWNMSSAYFKKTDPTIQYPTWFAFQPPAGASGNQFYGFPEVSWDHPGYIRVAPDFVMTPLSDPNQATQEPNEQELAYTAEWVRNNMQGLDPTPCFTSTCLVALSTIANKEMVIDFAPTYVPGGKDIAIYATGWAAKFIPLLGEILSQMALDGSTTYDISHFQMGHKFFKAI